MKNTPLVTVVTPVYNGEKFLEKTIQSIVNQTYNNIEYIIIDGGSTDRSVDIIKKYSNYISYWKSEPDNGMYDALNKGFQQAHGQIFAWLNSDDIYYSTTIENVVKIFNENPEIDWITGVCSFIDEKELITGIGIPTHYFRFLLRLGLYRGDYIGVIQQESTFWRKSLWIKCDGLNNQFKFAGDYDLWIKFSNYSKIYVIPTVFGAFRYHDNQLTNNIEEYYIECDIAKKIYFRFFWKCFSLPIKMLGVSIALFKIARNNTIKKLAKLKI